MQMEDNFGNKAKRSRAKYKMGSHYLMNLLSQLEIEIPKMKTNRAAVEEFDCLIYVG